MIFGLPTVASFICFLIAIFTFYSTKQYEKAKLLFIMILAYGNAVFLWVCMIFYLLYPSLFVILQSLFFYSFPLWHVLLHKTIFELTKTGKTEHFSILHYILPVIIPLISLIWSFFIPFDAQVYIVESRGEAMNGYETFTRLFTSKALVFLIWSIVYTLLSLRRIIIFRHCMKSYTANEERSHISWMTYFLEILCASLVMPFIGVFWGKTLIMGSFGMAIPVIIITIAMLILFYNIIMGNYVIIPSYKESSSQTFLNKKINREHFEYYIRTKKPYLNPQIRITDMTTDLCTNRTYLSNFINKEYGMNFSRYINHLRIEELNRLIANPAYQHTTKTELILRVGFNDTRNYQRAIKAENYNQ